jgi:hypothetical protein
MFAAGVDENGERLETATQVLDVLGGMPSGQHPDTGGGLLRGRLAAEPIDLYVQTPLLRQLNAQ